MPLSRAMPWSVLLLAQGCAQWPRHSNLPDSADTGAWPAGTDPSEALQVAWSSVQEHAEDGSPTGLPISGIDALGLDRGLLIQGSLDGSGWSDSPTELAGDCSGTLAFPVDSAGTYLGDVDWVAVQPGQAGTLCATLELGRDDVQVDLVPFLLDSCDEPAQELRDDQGAVLGYARSGATVSWSTAIEPEHPVGVVLAAYWPQAPELELQWRLGLSLVSAGICPTLPEAG